MVSHGCTIASCDSMVLYLVVDHDDGGEHADLGFPDEVGHGGVAVDDALPRHVLYRLGVRLLGAKKQSQAAVKPTDGSIVTFGGGKGTPHHTASHHTASHCLISSCLRVLNSAVQYPVQHQRMPFKRQSLYQHNKKPASQKKTRKTSHEYQFTIVTMTSSFHRPRHKPQHPSKRRDQAKSKLSFRNESRVYMALPCQTRTYACGGLRTACLRGRGTEITLQPKDMGWI